MNKQAKLGWLAKVKEGQNAKLMNSIAMTKDTSIGSLSLGKALNFNPSSMTLTPGLAPKVAFGTSSPSPSMKDLRDI